MKSPGDRMQRKLSSIIALVLSIQCRLIRDNVMIADGFSSQRITSLRTPGIISHTAMKLLDSRDSVEGRMTHEEQQQLLRETVETRRIRRIKADLALRSGNAAPLTLTVAKASGYGEEIELLEEAVGAGEAAREKLVSGNMGLVHHCVRDILKTRRGGSYLQSLSREDLVQEGAIGLARAVDRWNPEIGGRFSTYAVYWIRASVLRCIAEKDDFVKVPEHVSAAVRKISKAAQSLGMISEDLSDSFVSSPWKEAKAAKALAEEAGLSQKQFVEAMKIRERRRSGIVSLESWMKEKKKNVLKSSHSDSDDFDLFEINAMHLKSALSKFLRPKEVEALSWRYGLNDQTNPAFGISASKEKRAISPSDSYQRWLNSGKNGEALSFSEVGNKMHISAEYSRRLCHTAIQKLKHAVEEGLLEPALLCFNW